MKLYHGRHSFAIWSVLANSSENLTAVFLLSTLHLREHFIKDKS